MKDNRYTLGLVSVSFRQHTPREILEAMRAAGLSHIEWGSDVHAPCTDRARLTELAAMQKEYGIVCSSYGTYFRLGKSPMAELEESIAAAKILGTDILRLWCGVKSGEDYSEREKNELTQQCRQAADMAAAHNVILCMECHKNTYTQSLACALNLMHEVDSPHFQMYWQPFQWQTAEENLRYAEAIADFTRHIHVFQWKGEQRFSLSEGVVEWQNYLRQFSTPRTLLLEFMPDDQLSTLPIEANALRKIIGECV